MKSLNLLTLGALALGTAVLTGCFSSESNPASSVRDDFGSVVIQARTGNVDALGKPGLGKGAVITLDSLVITAISNASTPDTIVVGLAVGDSGFSADATEDQNIGVVLNLRALRSWTISAYTKDVNDSVIHVGSQSVNNLLAGQTRFVNLSANPLFAMYKAKFNFPDSIFSPSGLFGQQVQLSRIELIIDGELVADSIGTFDPATDYEISYDYVSVDADSVTLRVHGTLDGADAPWNAENLLYTRTRAIEDLNPTAVTQVALNWTGPTGGVSSLTVNIGKVGTFEIEGQTPDTVLAKR